MMFSYSIIPHSIIRSSTIAAITGLGLALTGCAAGDVEMNGAIFDYLGMGKAGPAKVSQAAERQALVLPPSLERLPAPGSGAANAAATGLAMPVNPETKVSLAAADQKRQQTEFCDKAMMRAKLSREIGTIQGPFGACNPSALEGLNGSNPLADVGGTNVVTIPKKN
jgi:hypothetical protein